MAGKSGKPHPSCFKVNLVNNVDIAESIESMNTGNSDKPMFAPRKFNVNRSVVRKYSDVITGNASSAANDASVESEEESGGGDFTDVTKRHRVSSSGRFGPGSNVTQTELDEFEEPESQALGQQNPWAIQYPARLWEQGSKNNNALIREAEKRVMRLADHTKHTLMMVYSGFSNTNPNEFTANAHRSIACSEYIDDQGNAQYFDSTQFIVTSANSSNVCILSAKNKKSFDRLSALGQVPYLKFNNFTKEQKVAGNIRIKSIYRPIITINVSGGEPENAYSIGEALQRHYTKFGGDGTEVAVTSVTSYVEFIRDEQLVKQKVQTGEMRLTISLPPGVDKELPTGTISVDLGDKGVRQLHAYQFGNKCCKICGGQDGCFADNVKRCLKRCKYCGLSFSTNHREATCSRRSDEAVVEQRWLVTKMEEDVVRSDMPVIDISASVERVERDMAIKRSSAWREEVVKKVGKIIKRVVDESEFGAEKDVNPFKDEETRKRELEKSKKKRRKRKPKQAGEVDRAVQERSSAQHRLVEKVRNNVPVVSDDVFNADTQVDNGQEVERSGDDTEVMIVNQDEETVVGAVVEIETGVGSGTGDKHSAPTGASLDSASGGPGDNVM